MPLILWDASGLVKRYSSEKGTATVNAVFVEVPFSDMAATPWGYLETYSILRRRYHGGLMDFAVFTSAITTLQEELIQSRHFQFIPIPDSAIFAASSLIDTHHINSADAAILSAYLQFRARLPLNSPPCLLVAADRRLLRAAQAEGFATLNPETLAASDVSAFFAAL